ncbi:hypothetical protein FRB90_002463, partial [Tulasnella sp. 427]
MVEITQEAPQDGLSPLWGRPVSELPVEMLGEIFRLGFDEAEMKHLWTQFHPAFSPQFTQITIDRSQCFPLSIEYTPKPDGLESSWPGFERFFELVGQKRDRWETLTAIVTPQEVANLVETLENAAPRLRSLNISVTSTLPDNIWRVLSYLQLLGGGSANLKDLKICGIPYLLNPNIFTQLASLSLTDGVRLTHNDFMSFLQASRTRLQELELIDIKFVGRRSEPRQHPIVLEKLQRLVLREMDASIGVAELYYAILATKRTCLYLEVSGMEPFGQSKFIHYIAPVIQKTLKALNRSTLRFRHHRVLDTTSWEGGGEPTSANCGPSFRIVSHGDGELQGEVFPGFLSRVLSTPGGTPEIEIDVEDSLSGILRGEISLEKFESTLHPSSFEALLVTSIVADAVDGHLKFILDFLAPSRQR